MPLSPEDLRRLAKELEGQSGVELEIVTERDAQREADLEAGLAREQSWLLDWRRDQFRKVVWPDVLGLGAIGVGGIMTSMLTRPGTTMHEWAIGVGAPAVMGAGAIVVKRLRGALNR